MAKTTVPQSTAKPKTKVFLLGVEMPNMDPYELDVQMCELNELVGNLDYEIVGEFCVRLKSPHPGFLLGTGKTKEVLEMAKASKAEVIVSNEELTPSQQRNWEKEGEMRTIDRQEIILEIFEDRAQTKEAVLQVQLARMEYSLPRLKRAWTHLDRQRGGGTKARGVGEKQIELDQRMVRDRIALLNKELTQVRQHRAVQRKSRERIPLVSGAIVGYTNAGKSTLLNKLTGADVLQADKLFATLDPTTRKLTLPTGQKLLLTDTVGFIRKLPHNLVEAFKATLEETVIADFLVHVIDASDPELENQRKTTMEVLEEIGATDKPIITVFNKVDALDPSAERMVPALSAYVSAKTGEGVDALLGLLQDQMKQHTQLVELKIPHSRYDMVNLLHEAGGVLKQKADNDGVYITGYLPPKVMSLFEEFVASEEPKEEPGKKSAEE